jgi:hypothetical protein
MMKFLLLLVCFASASTAQAPNTSRAKSTKSFKPTGTAQFDVGGDGVVIRYSGREWKVDLSNLHVDAEDCENPGLREKCAAHPGDACLPCITGWEPVAWDEPREIFYMAASTGTGQNRPWIILGYDLKAGKLTRILDDEGGGFDNRSVASPSGKYLAYVGYYSAGACASIGELVVVDVQVPGSKPFRLHLATVGDERPVVTGIRWTGEATVEYDAEMHGESECRAGIQAPSRRLTGQLEVTQALNRK